MEPDTDEICAACNGSGEGDRDGSYCTGCAGAGRRGADDPECWPGEDEGPDYDDREDPIHY